MKFKPGDIVKDIKYPQNGKLRVLSEVKHGYYRCKYIEYYAINCTMRESELELVKDAWEIWKRLNK